MRRLLRGMLILALLALIGLLAIYFWLLSDLPSPEAITDRTAAPSVRLVDRHGRLLYEVLGEETGRHARLGHDQIPDSVRLATVATEDRNFYHHPGVDWRGIVRALWINVRGGEVLAGGSTITQQLARNLLLEESERLDRTLRRKIRESWLAWRLARTFTKDELLDLYLNQTYYGGLAYGIEGAAQTFFGRPAEELTLAQAALLAGLPQAPALYNPFVDPEAAKTRQEVVLGLMLKEGVITPQEQALAVREALPYASAPYPLEAPHFVGMVQAELDRLLDPETLRLAGGVTVRTTLDLDWQAAGEKIVREQVERLNRPPDGGGSRQVSSGALVAIDPWTGDVLTLVGSPDFTDASIGGAINMALAPRQPGSTLKPLIYAAAMDPRRAEPFTAATMLLDVETVFTTREGESYVPVNFSRSVHGPVLLRQALGSSLNIPAVLALDAIGMEAGLDLMRDLGVEPLGSREDYDLSVALGGGAVRLFDLTRAYAALANGGERIEPRLILSLATAAGQVLYEPPPPQRTRVLDPRVAWLISDILSDNEARLLSFGSNSILNIGRTAAAKTGTTNDFHDNWTVGYTPELVAGAWVGNADNRPMVNVTGISGAGPIWHRFMRTVQAGRPDRPFARPEGLVQLEICALSGLLPTDACPFRRQEWFLAGTEPQRPDHLYRRIAVDRESGLPAGPETPPGRVVWETVLDLPPSAQDWARSNGLTLLSDLGRATGAAGGSQTAGAPLLLLRSPTPGVTYRLSTQLPAANQLLPLELISNLPLDQVTFYLNGAALATLTEPPYIVRWPLAIGRYELMVEAITGGGERLATEVVRFEVAPPQTEEELDSSPPDS